MAIWFEQNSKTYDCQAELRADSSTDVSDLPDFATEHNLKPGSECLIIQSAEVYMMKSDETWKRL